MPETPAHDFFGSITEQDKYRNVSPNVKGLVIEVAIALMDLVELLSVRLIDNKINEYKDMPIKISLENLEKALLYILCKSETAGAVRSLLNSDNSPEANDTPQSAAPVIPSHDYHSLRELRCLLLDNLNDIIKSKLFNQQPFRLIVLSQYLRSRATLKPGDTTQRWCAQVSNMLAKWPAHLNKCPIQQAKGPKGYYIVIP